ncbi:hypothetical protein AAFF_G00419900 [Aldrovandia affinis]|uniref:Gypsy retrotransposon integrase-like protein 1 n=1 Tax=Aldrovandia affinis TaxID=143900 RepID=A0AAD7SAI7_9TELE|nr:hypothetical protein AAFF_G00419900 [Aldrovandia affinis]
MTASILKSLRVPLLVGWNIPGLDRLYTAIQMIHGTQLMAASSSPPVGQYGRAQWDDPNLAGVRSQIQEVDRCFLMGKTPGKPYFTIRSRLLYQVDDLQVEELMQLLVPQVYMPVVLELVHAHIQGAHLGVEKTMEQLLQRYFRPGIYKAVKDFCRACPQCQITSPVQPPRMPLIPFLHTLREDKNGSCGAPPILGLGA